MTVWQEELEDYYDSEATTMRVSLTLRTRAPTQPHVHGPGGGSRPPGLGGWQSLVRERVRIRPLGRRRLSRRSRRFDIWISNRRSVTMLFAEHSTGPTDALSGRHT